MRTLRHTKERRRKDKSEITAVKCKNTYQEASTEHL
jgi:hypothetical protein